MDATNNRNYNCKDEELPVICKFTLASLKRDSADFLAYSPKFNQEYITGFESKITSAINIVEPQSETTERKLINGRIHTTMNSLTDPINRVIGYITLAPEIKLSATDFGLSALRSAIVSTNPENVLTSLPKVNLNITKYKDALKAQGMSDDLIAQFTNAATSIDIDYQKQHTIVSNRRGIVQNNITTLNILNDQLVEILNVGKIIYKSNDPAKVQDYTFAHLKNEIHPASKTATVSTDKKAGKTE